VTGFFYGFRCGEGMVISIRKIFPGWRSVAFAILVVAFLLQPSSLLAQTSPIPDRLPADTVFCVHWHGKKSFPSDSAKNHVLQLYADPDLAPLWQGLTNTVFGHKGDHRIPANMVISALSSLLDNPAVAGFVEYPDARVTASPQSVLSLGGFFLVYDETGKTDLINLLTAASESSPGTPPVSNYSFSGVSVEVREGNGKGRNVYSAHAEGYYLVSNQKRTIEDLITRFQGAGKPAASLGQSPNYHAIVKYLGSDTSLDIYGRVPDFVQWIPPGEKYKPIARFVEALHLEKVHAVGEGVSFSGEATRVRGAILGDTSPHGLFDTVGASGPVFLTQPAVAMAPAIRITRVDFRAAYHLLRAGIMAALTPEQASNVTTVESMAQSYLGMSIADALGLFTGEIASGAYYSEDGTQQAVIAATIEDQADVLRVLEAAAGKLIVAEDSSGDTTYLDLLFPYKDPAAGTQRRMFYYLAVTPKMALAAPRKAMLRAAVERLKSQAGAAPSGSIFADSEYIQLRSLLPANLSGLTGSEIDQIPWDKIAARLEDQLGQSRKQSNSHAPDLAWLKQVDFGVMSRHLHRSVGGWWKDSTGIYFDSYLQ